MGERKRILDGRGADGWPLDGVPGWVLSYLAPLNSKARGERLTELHAALLDAARTEGRGAGEPVASDKALFDALWELVAAMANEGIPKTPRTKAAFKVAHQAALDRLRKDWSAPIREPEISRTGPMFILPGEDPVEYMALMRQKAAEMDREVFLEELAEAMFKVDEKHGPIRMNVPYGALKSFQRKQYERYAEAVADAILNLAPVGGRGEEGSSRADLSPPKLSDLDRVWAAVNVLGAPDTACTSDEDRAYCRAIGDALSEIEKLGGRPQ